MFPSKRHYNIVIISSLLNISNKNVMIYYKQHIIESEVDYVIVFIIHILHI